jgi:RNA polymerase sigma-70 factor (ECF subfamily)
MTAHPVTAEQADVTALRAGDEATFRRLFAQHHRVMKRVARSYVSSDAVAEEVVQETWLAVVSGIDRFEGRSALATWIFSVLINQAKTHQARERRSVPLSCIGDRDDRAAVDADRFEQDEDAWPGHWATPPRPWQKPDRRLLSLEARDHLRSALAELPARQRLVVALRDVEGASAAEVRDLLALSPENQRVLLHRGRSRLRSLLEGYMDEA